MKVLIVAACLFATFAAVAVAETCPTCGSEITDTGRCPYCKPKPKAEAWEGMR